ncbi:MAG: helix-turn-helix transcriptional regulator [bacterium]|nr:helix-turn-helix transcriptional regulator [bacterium]
MIGEELEEARRKLGLHQAAFGVAIGQSASNIYSMEAGRRDIRLTVELAVRYRLVEAGINSIEDFQ